MYHTCMSASHVHVCITRACVHYTCICVSHVHVCITRACLHHTCMSALHVHVCITRACVYHTCMCVSHVHVCITRACLHHTCMCALHVHACITRACVYHTCISRPREAALGVGKGSLSPVCSSRPSAESRATATRGRRSAGEPSLTPVAAALSKAVTDGRMGARRGYMAVPADNAATMLPCDAA